MNDNILTEAFPPLKEACPAERMTAVYLVRAA